MKKSKVKIIKISLVLLTVMFVLILGGMFVFYYVDTQIVNKPEESKAEVRPLTEEEQTFVGVWEADEGSLLAVRARGGYEAENFALDAIYYIPNANHEWGKITRDIDTTLEKNKELLVISDKFECPDATDPEGIRTVPTEERLEYDSKTDTITHISIHQSSPENCSSDTGEIFEYKTIFHRTDRGPTDKSIDWDWYYDIHPNRKP